MDYRSKKKGIAKKRYIKKPEFKEFLRKSNIFENFDERFVIFPI